MIGTGSDARDVALNRPLGAVRIGALLRFTELVHLLPHARAEPRYTPQLLRRKVDGGDRRVAKTLPYQPESAFGLRERRALRRPGACVDRRPAAFSHAPAAHA
jgi:hypothetical protein